MKADYTPGDLIYHRATLNRGVITAVVDDNLWVDWSEKSESSQGMKISMADLVLMHVETEALLAALVKTHGYGLLKLT